MTDHKNDEGRTVGPELDQAAEAKYFERAAETLGVTPPTLAPSTISHAELLVFLAGLEQDRIGVDITQSAAGDITRLVFSRTKIGDHEGCTRDADCDECVREFDLTATTPDERRNLMKAIERVTSPLVTIHYEGDVDERALRMIDELRMPRRPVELEPELLDACDRPPDLRRSVDGRYIRSRGQLLGLIGMVAAVSDERGAGRLDHFELPRGLTFQEHPPARPQPGSGITYPWQQRMQQQAAQLAIDPEQLKTAVALHPAHRGHATVELKAWAKGAPLKLLCSCGRTVKLSRAVLSPGVK